MESLTTLCARTCLDTKVLPLECLERVVEESKVYGLLWPVGLGKEEWDDNEFEYEGFYSTRQKTEQRAAHLAPLFCRSNEQFIRWMKTPVEELDVMRKKGYYYITEHPLFPGHSRVGIHVYFSGSGMVSNLEMDVGNNLHIQYTLDQFNMEVTQYMREQLLDHLNDVLCDTITEITKEIKDRLYNAYGLSLAWSGSDKIVCDCPVCVGQARAPGFTGEYFDGLSRIFGDEEVEMGEETELGG
jgi:hypothetical protein